MASFAEEISSAVFEVRLEKKGRGQNFSMMRPWSVRSFKVTRQTLSYYDGTELKGELNLRGASCVALNSADAQGKPYPMKLSIANPPEVMILNAPSEEVRKRCMEIFSSASLRVNWKPPQKRESELAKTTASEEEGDGDGEEREAGSAEASSDGPDGSPAQQASVVSGGGRTESSPGSDGGKIHGSSSRDQYEGDTLNGQPHGSGKKTFKNGDKYEGEWYNGQPNGKGKMLWITGNAYEGDWLNGRCHGYGVLHAINGDKYEGQFVDDAMHGEGRYTHADGKVYVGSFEADKPHGDGVLYLPDGAGQLEGTFVDGALRGNAIYVDPNGVEKRMKMPE